MRQRGYGSGSAHEEAVEGLIPAPGECSHKGETSERLQPQAQLEDGPVATVDSSFSTGMPAHQHAAPPVPNAGQEGD